MVRGKCPTTTEATRIPPSKHRMVWLLGLQERGHVGDVVGVALRRSVIFTVAVLDWASLKDIVETSDSEPAISVGLEQQAMFA